MATKWRNNKNMESNIISEKINRKSKTWLGVLLICMFTGIMAGATLFTGLKIVQEKQKISKQYEKEYQEQKNDKLSLDKLEDEGKMSLLSNIYYLDYKLQYMYNNKSYKEFLLGEHKGYQEANQEVKKQYDNVAKEYMNVLYSVYESDFTLVNGNDIAYSTSTYVEDKALGVSTGVDRLENIEDKAHRKELLKEYAGFLVVNYDANGKLHVRTYGNVESDNIGNYLTNMKLKPLYEYMIDRIEYYTLIEGGEEDDFEITSESGDEYDEEITREEEENSGIITSTSPEIDFPVLKNVKAVIGFRLMEGGVNSPDFHELREDSMLFVLVSIILVGILALILQNISPLNLKNQFIFRMPTELVVFAGSVGVIILFGEEPFWIFQELLEDLPCVITGIPQAGYGIPFLIFFLIFAYIYWGWANVLPYLLHPFENLAEKSICVRVYLWMFHKLKEFLKIMTTYEISRPLKQNILKIVLLNAVVMAVCAMGWFLGIFGVVGYSIVLYIILLKRGRTEEEHYKKVKSMADSMAAGNLDVEPSMEHMGFFEPLHQSLGSIQKGFSKAVEEEVKSQNMKTELITNVSHDLKTPLTAIITYVDLLKDESITEEQRNEYIQTLDRKSQRLKVLIEDLFEVSKASSDNITLNYADVDLVSLVKQVRLENEERIENARLHFRWNLSEEKCMVRVDPQRTYRIIENLFINALKYSMEDSRVYVELNQRENHIVFSMKNISAVELNISPEQLTSRFVRGDVSRNTEGSGLGLAIVKTFTTIQGGTFDLSIDGDLFKAEITFPKI